jgi:hypothetical protein
MPYRVLDNEELNRADRRTDKSNYAMVVEAALNHMEEAGWSLVQIEQAVTEDDSPYYIFYKEDGLQ